MKKVTTIFLLVSFMIFPCIHLQAQETKPDDVLGTWYTIDDETARKKSVVKLWRNDYFVAKINYNIFHIKRIKHPWHIFVRYIKYSI